MTATIHAMGVFAQPIWGSWVVHWANHAAEVVTGYSVAADQALHPPHYEVDPVRRVLLIPDGLRWTQHLFMLFAAVAIVGAGASLPVGATPDVAVAHALAENAAEVIPLDAQTRRREAIRHRLSRNPANCKG